MRTAHRHLRGLNGPSHHQTWWVLLVLLLALTALVPRTQVAGAQREPWPNAAEDPSVTPVSGASTLTRLHLALDRTYLGQGSKGYGTPDASAANASRNETLGVPRVSVITGADLYRLNCQACHTAAGTGAPTEVRSVLGAVQSSSLDIVRKQLQSAGGTQANAQRKAAQARADLTTRIHRGGQLMPAREHLDDADTTMLYAYLTVLAGTPHPEKQQERTITWARVGEHVVKGTCHICHDATGPTPSAQALVAGKIPSLKSVMEAKAVAELVWKVRHGGAVGRNGTVLHRGRMPVFSYLKSEEIAAAYMYLATYPPQSVKAR
jgi:mono/diheme cytochrome c family protein